MTPRQRNLIPVAEIASKNGCSLSEILSKTRLIKIVRVRDEAIYEIWKRKDMSLAQIGRIFNRHHSSIYSSLGRHMDFNGIEHEYAEAYRLKKSKQKKVNQKARVLSDAAQARQRRRLA